MIHLQYRHADHGPIPLCGQAMWDDLTALPERNECWECASIAGAYSPDLQERFNVNADGSERYDPIPQNEWHNDELLAERFIKEDT